LVIWLIGWLFGYLVIWLFGYLVICSYSFCLGSFVFCPCSLFLALGSFVFCLGSLFLALGSLFLPLFQKNVQRYKEILVCNICVIDFS